MASTEDIEDIEAQIKREHVSDEKAKIVVNELNDVLERHGVKMIWHREGHHNLHHDETNTDSQEWLIWRRDRNGKIEVW